MSFQRLDVELDLGPSASLMDQLKAVPARWAVYLLADAEDRPIQLLCVKNLRASLVRRLIGEDAAPVGRRVDYRQIVRRVHYTRVDSALEADLVYLETARSAFPESYRKTAGLRPAWFVHVDPDAPFPRYRKTTDINRQDGVHFGPIDGRESAQRLVESMEDWFDLCRYHDVLMKAPAGRASAYKDMGRCPAPCDGSISMEPYRQLIRYSMTALDTPQDYVRQQEERMRLAAAELKFEIAGRIQKHIESFAVVGTGPYRHVRRLNDFRYVSLQRGPRAGTAKLFLTTPARVDVVACLLTEPVAPSALIELVCKLAAEWSGLAVDEPAAERVGVVAQHLFETTTHGTFIPLDQLDERNLRLAYRQIAGQKQADATEDEGVVRELGTE